jgi:AcrR family transcriptional regulator
MTGVKALTRATRRSPAEVRALIVSAAHELFEERGYAETATREIAELAGVIPAAVFRHFGSKQELFEEVVLNPLYEYVHAFVDRWSKDETWRDVTPEQVAHAHVSGLYDLVRQNRKLFAMLVSAGEGEQPGTHAHLARDALSRHLDELERRLVVFAEQQHAPALMDLGLSIRFTIALVLGTVMFDDTLFAGPGRRPTRQQMIRQIAGYVQRGSQLPETRRSPPAVDGSR